MEYELDRPAAQYLGIICGQFVDRILSTQPTTKNGNGCKTLRFPWWLQLSKRQILTFLPRLSFGTVRSEVRILSPRPVKSSTYGYLQRWPFLFCGRIVADAYSFNCCSFRSIRRMRVTTRSL